MRNEPSMRRRLLLAVLVSLAVALWAAPGEAQTVSIPVLNSQFVFDTLPCSPGSGCNTYGISGWVTGPSTYVLKAGTSQFPTAPPTGLYVAALGSTTATGSMFQQLGATIQANMAYAAKITIGARADVVFTGYQASLLAGNTVLASNNRSIPAGGTFVTDLVVYMSGAIPGQLGQPLQILIRSIGTGQADIASVSVTATPTAAQ